MLFLLFELGKDRYAIEAKRVVEVLPYVQIKRVPEAPGGVAGIINYRGEPVPILDFSEVALGTPAREYLSTRIIIGTEHSRRVEGTTVGGDAGGERDGVAAQGAS